MTNDEKKEMTRLEQEVTRLQQEVNRLMDINSNLVSATQLLLERNVDIYERLDIYYNVRNRVELLTDIVRRHREVLANADLRKDEDLMAMIEARIEGEDIPLPPEFGVKEVAELVGTTQGRIIDLYKKKSIYRSLDKYLDYLRLMRALRMLKEHPAYNIEAIAQDAGFNSVRTLQRKIEEAVGVTPGQFRDINNPQE